MPKKLPIYKSEDEERKFWGSHDVADYFNLETAEHAVFPKLKP
ncbi:MAG: hypothetical protein GY866_12435, partial [Proteobacteria bacterium]|nr:hypothetical protein [Pseudomonadota bacterium]